MTKEPSGCMYQQVFMRFIDLFETNQPEEWRTGLPVTFHYVRRVGKTPNMGALYQQNIEPHGRYMLLDPFPNHPAGKNEEKGTVSFKNPLVIDAGDGYDHTSWKSSLVRHFGRKGRKLSLAILNDGYDGIVSIDKYGPSEIVDLTSFK